MKNVTKIIATLNKNIPAGYAESTEQLQQLNKDRFSKNMASHNEEKVLRKLFRSSKKLDIQKHEGVAPSETKFRVFTLLLKNGACLVCM